MERVAARTAAVAPETLGGAREQLEALLSQVAVGGPGGRAAADRLPKMLEAFAAAEPASDAAAYFRRLLEAGALDGLVDSTGLPCKAAVIQAQLSLGFPLALEVNPDDLAWFRETTEALHKGPTASRTWTALMAVLSMGWSTTMTLLIAAQTHGNEEAFATPFLLGGLHGLAALTAAAIASPSLPLESRRAWRTLYRILNKMGWLGPGLSLLASLLVLGAGRGSNTALLVAGLVMVGLFCAAPAMLTAVACGVAGKRLVPEDEDPRGKRP